MDAGCQPIPEKIGKFHIVEPIGRGAMGTVYKAYDTVIERWVALKTLRPDLVTGQAAASDTGTGRSHRLVHEARAAGRLNHPNIVTIHDLGEQDGLFYLVMEWVDGPSLRTVLRGGARLSLPEVRFLIGHILRALDYAHDAGVIHRDVKPANILLTCAGEVKVTDFGIAHVGAPDPSEAGRQIGSPAYMSPEQYRGDGIDRRTDVFSAGLVLYEMLTGTMAFCGDGVRAQVLSDPTPQARRSRDDVPAAIDAVIARATAKAPGARYETAREMAAAVKAAIAGSATAEGAVAARCTEATGPVTLAPAPVSPSRSAAEQPATASKVSRAQRFEPNQMIFREGDLGDCAYFIESGSVDISVGTVHRRVLIARLGKKQLFGELALLDGSPRSASATTSTGCEVVVITRDLLDREIARLDPFMRYWLHHMARQIRVQLSRAGTLLPPPKLAAAELSADGRSGDEPEARDASPLKRRSSERVWAPTAREPTVHDRRIYWPNDMIFQEDEIGSRAFIVRSGKVRLTRKFAGVTTTLAEFGTDQLFGELALIDDKPRSATAVAIEKTELMVIDAARLKTKIEGLSGFMKYWTVLLTDRLRDLSRRQRG